MNTPFSVPFLAAAPTTADKLRQIPTQAWINLAICILAVVLVIRTWHALKKFNDYAPWFGAALAGSFIMFYWVYERTEPPFMTPIVEKLTFFMPSKSHQEQQLDKLKKNRDALSN